MKKSGLIAVIVALALVVTISVTVVVQTSSDGPEKVMRKFVSAYNSADLTKMLECLDPEIARPAQALMGLAESLLGFDLNDVIGLMPAVVELMPAEYELAGTQPKISCEIHDTVIDGDEATMNVTLLVKANGEEQSETGDLNFIKIDGDWYMTE